ncbi:MAG: tetratricopeptide repeat-containing sensor histidine kinase [Lacinutrix venerupis]
MSRLIVLFFVLFSLSGFSQEEELESLRIELTFQNPDTTKVKTSLKIINLLYKSKDYDSALKYIKGAQMLSENLNYQKGLADITYYKALIYNCKDDYINASSEFHKAKQIFETLQDTLALAKVKNQLGVLEIERGNYKKGLKYAHDGINELEKRALFEDLAIAYKSIAKAYNKTHVTEKAIDYYLQSLEVQERINNVDGIIENNVDLAKLYLEKNDYKRTIRYYENALNYIESNDNELKANILADLGGAYLKSEDLKTAGDYLVESIKLNRKLKNESGILKTLNNLGELNLIKKNYKIAEQQFLEAGNLGRQQNNKLELLKNYKLMKTLDSTKGRFESAFGWQREYFKIKSSLDAEKTNFEEIVLDEATNNEAENDTILQAQTIAPIETQDVDSKQKLDRLKLIFYAVLAAFAVVLVFFILFFLKRNNRAKYTRELEVKNQKIELQNEAILEQSKHLESINNVKDKLFSIVSHDLKDSLTSTKGFIDLLKDGQLSQDEFHSLLPELSENANNASLLLFNLLNWSKSQMQSLKPKPSLFDIQQVFHEKIKLIEQKTQKKSIILIDNTMRDFVYADRSMVEIIIQNLLANAVKFCVKNDTITISNKIENGNAIISVADSGIGISVENQHKLFGNNTFTTIGTENEKGTGLGLTICRELVELNQGRIWVDSEVNIGSTFFIELPKTRIENPINT